jgi:predicted RNA-binding protein YlqC (UPF0109 family)
MNMRTIGKVLGYAGALISAIAYVIYGYQRDRLGALVD